MSLENVDDGEVYDLASAVEHLANIFEDLAYDAQREVEYGLDNFDTYDECIDAVREYQRASQACNIYLHTSNLKSFLYTMKDMEYENFLDEVKTFISAEIIQEVFDNTT